MDAKSNTQGLTFRSKPDIILSSHQGNFMKTVKALVVATAVSIGAASSFAQPAKQPEPKVTTAKKEETKAPAPATPASDAKSAERPKAKTPKDKQKEKDAKAEAAKESAKK